MSKVVVDMKCMEKFIRKFKNHSSISREELIKIKREYNMLQKTWRGNQANKFAALFENYQKSTMQLLSALEEELIPDIKKKHELLQEFEKMR